MYFCHGFFCIAVTVGWSFSVDGACGTRGNNFDSLQGCFVTGRTWACGRTSVLCLRLSVFHQCSRWQIRISLLFPCLIHVHADSHTHTHILYARTHTTCVRVPTHASDTHTHTHTLTHTYTHTQTEHTLSLYLTKITHPTSDLTHTRLLHRHTFHTQTLSDTYSHTRTPPLALHPTSWRDSRPFPWYQEAVHLDILSSFCRQYIANRQKFQQNSVMYEVVPIWSMSFLRLLADWGHPPLSVRREELIPVCLH